MPNDPKIIPLLPIEQSVPTPDPQAFRNLYQSLRGDESTRKAYIIMLLDQMDQMSDAAIIQKALTEQEFFHLRYMVYSACTDDVMEELNPTGTRESSRFLLARYYHAIQLLRDPADEDFEDLYLIGLLCAALDRHREARDFFQKALALQPDHAGVQSVLSYVTDCMSFPRFRAAFVSRCMNAWKSIAVLLKDPSIVFDAGEYVTAIARKNFRIWTGMDVQLVANTPHNGALEISIRKDWQLSLFPAEALVRAEWHTLPESVCRTWASYPVLYFDTSDLQGNAQRTAYVITTQTVLVDTPEHDGVHVKLYHQDLVSHAASPEVLDVLTSEIVKLLGPEDFLILIRSVEILVEPPRRSNGNLYQLPDLLEGLGYTLEHQLGDLENIRMRRAYTRQPQEGTPFRLRDDITQGDTLIWRLQEEYEKSETATADYYMERGIAPVFLAWPRSIMDCGEEDFTEKLVRELSKGDVSGNVKILGKASGTEYCYLDMLLWSTFIVVDTVEAFFARIPGGDAVRIQSFYYDAYPCPVSRSYLQEHAEFRLGSGTVKMEETAKIEEAAQSAAPPSPKRSSTQPKPKAKKKNTAKAKRKHSKKFH